MSRESAIRCVLLACIATLFSIHAHAQLLDSLELDTVREYKSLEEALENPEKVYKLNLKRKRLREIPAEVFRLKHLQVLILKKNHLTALSPRIGELKFLQELDLSKNALESLPAEIGELIHLKYLRINQNELFKLPAEVGNLRQLVYLDLWSNNLDALPDEIAELKSLKVVDLRVIQMNEEAQKEIKKLLPNATIHFSKSCNCD